MEIINYPKYRLLDGKVVSALRNFALICDERNRVWVEDLNSYTRFIRVNALTELAIVPKKPKRKYSARKKPLPLGNIDSLQNV